MLFCDLAFFLKMGCLFLECRNMINHGTETSPGASKTEIEHIFSDAKTQKIKENVLKPK